MNYLPKIQNFKNTLDLVREKKCLIGKMFLISTNVIRSFPEKEVSEANAHQDGKQHQTVSSLLVCRDT